MGLQLHLRQRAVQAELQAAQGDAVGGGAVQHRQVQPGLQLSAVQACVPCQAHISLALGTGVVQQGDHAGRQQGQATQPAHGVLHMARFHVQLASPACERPGGAQAQLQAGRCELALALAALARHVELARGLQLRGVALEHQLVQLHRAGLPLALGLGLQRLPAGSLARGRGLAAELGFKAQGLPRAARLLGTHLALQGLHGATAVNQRGVNAAELGFQLPAGWGSACAGPVAARLHLACAQTGF